MTLYFCDNEDTLKIGFTDDLPGRLYKHLYDHGLIPIAVMPGDQDAEDKILSELRRCGIRPKKGNEWFKKDERIYEWIWQLLENEFATDNLEYLEHIPEIPVHVWMYGKINKRNQTSGGQLMLWDSLPASERLRAKAAHGYNNSLSDEWYTPQSIIICARNAMGSIDTDPATTVAVNLKYINARTFYTKTTNGLNRGKPWVKNTWLNPPYGTGENSAGKFIERLLEEIDLGNVTQAITCLNLNSMCSKWFYTMVSVRCRAHCIINGRLDFVPPGSGEKGGSPTKGTVLSFFGGDVTGFVREFERIGQILWPIKSEYNAKDDFAKSIDVCYDDIRKRMANGGLGYEA